MALEDDEGLLAAVVPWSGHEGFPGYSRHARGEGPVAWELGGAHAVFERFTAAAAYWASWDEKPGPWQRIQEAQMEAYRAALGHHSRYFAIDGEQWPPKALIRIDRRNDIVLATVGVALRPQPRVELDDAQPERLRRIELAMRLPAGTPEADIRDWASYMSAQASLPWAQYTWLGPGHTIRCDVAAARGFTAVMLARGEALDRLDALPGFNGDLVRLLWVVPITRDEHARAQKEGSKAVLPALHDVERA